MDIRNGGKTVGGRARTAVGDPERTLNVHRSTCEIVLDFERSADVKLATDRYVQA
jgi:hypothetical protein